MRQGEILRFHKSDVDLDKGVIHVRYQVQPIRGKGLAVTEVKTKKSRRPATLPSTALVVLGEHLQTVEEGPIFTTSTGNPISARNLYRHFKKVIEETDVPDIRFQDHRHTHATILLRLG